MIGVVPCRSHAALCFGMSARGDSTNAVGKGQKGGRKGTGVGRTWTGRLIELFSEWEFQEGFCIPNNIFVLLVGSDPIPIEK